MAPRGGPHPVGQLFWATSTPVPNARLSPPRKQSDVPVYSAAAAEVMRALRVPTIDMFAFVLDPRLCTHIDRQHTGRAVPN